MLPRIWLVLLLVGVAFSGDSSKIGNNLHRSFKRSTTVNIFVKFQGGNEAALNSMDGLVFMTRGHRIRYLVSQLKVHAKSSQKRALSILHARSPAVVFKEFWISNEIYIKNADASLVELIGDLPEVAEIYEEPIFNVASISEAAPSKSPNAVEWNIEKIEADKAWEMPGGNNGVGTVVANIDTGVRGTHEALRGNFRATKGWYDPYYQTEKPEDISGQGTLTMGLAVGNGGIGVAPGAQWISCKGCDVITCNMAELKMCTQFILCPTDPNGENEDCNMAPNVVANGYGGGVGNNAFDEVFQAWTAAGIVPVYAVGTISQPICDSVASYGDNERVIGVGSTTMDDASSRRSALGPNLNGTIKPDITAPGENVRSAAAAGDAEYMYITGTTMATAHVAGVAALLISDDPTLSYQQVKSLMENNADTNLTDTGMVCGGIPSTTFPNNQYGHGRLNARRALETSIRGRM